MGKPWRADDDLLLADLGLPFPAPPNHASITRASLADDSEAVARRTLDFFSSFPGGGFQVWSLWPSLDLSKYGFSMGPTPCMVRDGGGEKPDPPSELKIEEVTDGAGMEDFWTVLNDVFLGGRTPRQLWGRPRSQRGLPDLARPRRRPGRHDGSRVPQRRLCRCLRGRNDSGRTRPRLRRGDGLAGDHVSAGPPGDLASERDGKVDLRTHGLPGRRGVQRLASERSTALRRGRSCEFLNPSGPPPR
jgi:hypothetical protein